MRQMPGSPHAWVLAASWLACIFLCKACAQHLAEAWFARAPKSVLPQNCVCAEIINQPMTFRDLPIKIQCQTLWPHPDVCNQGDAVGSSWIWNFQPKRRHYVMSSDNVHQASLCTWPMAEQIWVLVQARYHLLAETLHRKMIGPECQLLSVSRLELDSTWKSPFVHASAVTYKVMTGWCWQKIPLAHIFWPYCQQDDLSIHLWSPYRSFNLPQASIKFHPCRCSCAVIRHHGTGNYVNTVTEVFLILPGTHFTPGLRECMHVWVKCLAACLG